MKNRPNGEYSESHDQCASNFMKDFICTPQKDSCLPTDKSHESCNNKHCDEDQECTSGFCDIVANQPNRCRRADSETNRENGDFCDAKDAQCKSGKCAHHKCEPKIPACTQKDCWQKLGTTNHPCNNDGDCEDNAYCRMVGGQRNTCRKSGGGRLNGEYCDAPNQCSSRICNGYICRQCSTDAHCGSNKWCHGNKCYNKRKHAEGCHRNEVCQSGTCSHFTQHKNNKRQKQCCNGRGSDPPEKKWYTWAGGPQLCKNQPDGHECSHGEQCANGVCYKGTCRGKFGLNERCGSDGECQSGTCASLTKNDHNRRVKHCCNGKGQWYTWTGGPNLCKNQPHNRTCSYSQQCASGRECHEGTCKNKSTSYNWTPCHGHWWHGRNGGGPAQCKAYNKGDYTGQWHDCGKQGRHLWNKAKVRCKTETFT